MNFAEWLIEEKNGKYWKKYGKERIYFNFYFKWGGQITSFFYDVLTDKFFGDYGTGEEYRKEFEEAATKETVEEAVTDDKETFYQKKNRKEELGKELTKKYRFRLENKENLTKEEYQKLREEEEKIEKEIISLRKEIEEKEQQVKFQEIKEEEIPEEIKKEFSSKVENSDSAELTKMLNRLVGRIQYDLHFEQKIQEKEIELVQNKQINNYIKEQAKNYIFEKLQQATNIINLDNWKWNNIINIDVDNIKYWNMYKEIQKFLKENGFDNGIKINW